jgi:putative oxidoreductase
VQRPFLSFPNGLQGTGLFLLRTALAAGLFADAITRLRTPDFLAVAAALAVSAAVAELLAGALVWVGFRTAIVASLICLLQLALLALTPGEIELHLLRSAVSLCLALVGPGAWSVDARLFGRRRVEIHNLRDN